MAATDRVLPLALFFCLCAAGAYSCTDSGSPDAGLDSPVVPTGPAPDCPVGYLPAEDTGHCLLDRPEINPEWDAPWPNIDPKASDCETEVPEQWSQQLFDECENTFDGDKVFTTEPEMAAFCEEYDCVSGGIDIGMPEDDQPLPVGERIESLEGLACIKASRYLFIGGNTHLVQGSLPNLTGLGGALNVNANPVMTHLSLPSLRVIGGDLSVQYNDSLSSLGLQSLELIHEFVFVIDNQQLPTQEAETIRDGLCSEHIGGAVLIAGNAH